MSHNTIRQRINGTGANDLKAADWDGATFIQFATDSVVACELQFMLNDGSYMTITSTTAAKGISPLIAAPSDSDLLIRIKGNPGDNFVLWSN